MLKCPVCSALFDPCPSSAGGRPREVCSDACRTARYRLRREERARSEGRRSVLEDLEALVLESDDETWRAYAALGRDVPAFRSTLEGTLRRARDATERRASLSGDAGEVGGTP